MNYQYGQAGSPMTKPMPNSANYQYGHPGMYGSSGPFVAPTISQKGPFARGVRQRLNIVAVLITLFVPWLLFTLMYWTMTFSLHKASPFLCHVLLLLGLGVVAITGFLAFDAIKKKREAGTAQFLSDGNATYREPTWLIVLFATCFLAWTLGVIGGDVNFFHNLEPYYDLINLNTYPNVDPSRARGQQLMDAGRIVFSEGTTLDLSRSMGFKNLQQYCVAPIVAGSDPKHISSYDFWAVGVNCCSGTQADFHCGEFNNARAGAGLRLMRDDQRAFFRLAVQQAEAAYNIRADHPLFFYWMHDPNAEVMSYMDEGYKYFLIGVICYFIFQLFLVVVFCMIFSKMTTIA